MEYNLLIKVFLDLFKFKKIEIRQSDLLTFASDSDRPYLFNNKYYSPHIDTIEDDYFELTKKKPVSISRISSLKKGSNTHGDVYAPDGPFARALLQKRIDSLINPSHNNYSKWEEKLWGVILDKVKPTKVVGILPSRELCKASHDRGIWVSDVQHGVIAKNHPWYGSDFRNKDHNSLLPDVFYVWDKQSAEVLEDWCVEKESTVTIIGNRWLARFLNPSQNDSLANNALSVIRNHFNEADKKKSILITLSWGEKDIPRGQVPPEILKVILRTYDKYNWFVRLHPSQLSGFASSEFNIFKKHYDEKLKGKVEWEISTYCALPAILSSIDVHLSWMSSVAIEASQFGVKTGLLSPRLKNDLNGDYYNYYNDLGLVSYLENTDKDIEKFIESAVSNKHDIIDYKIENINYNRFIKFLAE